MDRETLNENQQRHFVSSCQYVDRLLGEMEAILAAGERVAAELSRVRALRNRIDAVHAGRSDDEEVRGHKEDEPGLFKRR